MSARILHIDMDAFFAGVECARNPALRGQPLIIGGLKEDKRGVVSTASYEARKFGVHSAMPLATAKRLCPHGIYMRVDMPAYSAASRRVREILETVSPLVEMASIDEAYIDVTGSLRLFGGDEAIAAHIKREIAQQLDLTCTIAVASNRLVSKVASAEVKPDGYIAIADGEEAAYFAPLPVKKLPGAGPRTCESLEALGIRTLGELASAPIGPLERKFGLHTALHLQRRAQGIASTEVEPERAPKSISRETTFSEDLQDWERLETILFKLAQSVMMSVRKQEMLAQRITLKVRYKDFETKTFSKTLEEPTCVDAVVLNALHELIPKGRQRNAPVRLIGIGLDSLRPNHQQLRLFESEQTEKWERALESADAIRNKHGLASLRSAKSIKPPNRVE